MFNQFVDKSALCSALSQVRVRDPFYVADDEFEPSYGTESYACKTPSESRSFFSTGFLRYPPVWR